MMRAGSIVFLITFLFTFLSLTAGEAKAQQSDTLDDYGAWFMFMGEGRFAKDHPEYSRIRWWFDAQARFLNDSNGYDQGLLRPGLGYDLSDEVSVWLGYAWVHSEPEGSRSFEENRIWQQLLWTKRFEPVNFMSRTRLEQRFVETGSETGWRFRQFFKLSVPFDESRLGLAAYDELFFDLNNTDWGADTGFRQNRLFAGFSWKLNENGGTWAEIGYLNQFLNNQNRSDRMNHILSINLFVKFG